jgi:hypothetical protein
VVVQTTCGPHHFQRTATGLLAAVCRTSRFVESTPGRQRDPSRTSHVSSSLRPAAPRESASRAYLSAHANAPPCRPGVDNLLLISKALIRRENMSSDNTKSPPPAISHTHGSGPSGSASWLGCPACDPRRARTGGGGPQDGRPIEARQQRGGLRTARPRGAAPPPTSERCGPAGPRADSSGRSPRDRGSCRQPCCHLRRAPSRHCARRRR